MRSIFLILLTFFVLRLVSSNFDQPFYATEQNHLFFRENKGQLRDELYQPRPDILFSGQSESFYFHLLKNGISYQIHHSSSRNAYLPFKGMNSRNKVLIPDSTTIQRIDLRWIGSNFNARAIPGLKLPGYDNYYLSHCPNGILQVNSYGEVLIEDIYSGIDVRYYSENGKLKYDYLVAANVNYQNIKISVAGATCKIDVNGDLLLITPCGTLIEKAPVVYQNGNILKSKFELHGNILSFDIQGYSSEFPLIIDPATRIWGTYYGGGNTELPECMVKDNFGNLYATGVTHSSVGSFIATSGSHQQVFGGAQECFLTKFSSNGTRLWGTFYGGTGFDYAYGCTTDPSGNVFMTGVTTSGNPGVISTSGSYQTNYSAGQDGFVVKFNSSGVRLWGTYIGAAGGNEEMRACKASNNGDVYVVGYSTTPTISTIATPGCHQSSHGGGVYDGILLKFNPSGNLLWGTFYGGTGDDSFYDCSIDSFGNLYLVGITTTSAGGAISTPSVHQSNYAGGGDAFIAKFTSSGNRLWGTYYGGSADDLGVSCATDTLGNLLIAGYSFGSTTGIASTNAHQSSAQGSVEGILAKFNPSGQRVWGTYYGGIGADRAYCVTTDPACNIFLCGLTDLSTSTLIATAASHQTYYAGGTDAFVAKFHPTGVRDWGTYYGGGNFDVSTCVQADSNGDIYFGGQTTSIGSGIISTPGAHQTAFGGLQDAFFVKLRDCPVYGISVNTIQPKCSGDTVVISGSINNPIGSYIMWAGPNSFTSGVLLNSIPNANSTSSGIYTLSTGDGLGCIENKTLSVVVHPSPTVQVNSGTICFGGSFTIMPTGANSYSIQGGSTIVTPGTNSTYTVVGISGSGCSSSPVTSSVSVLNNPTISVNSGTICSGNSFTIAPTGALTYSVQGGSFIVNPSANTSYSVVGQDTNACISTPVFANVFVNMSPTITVNSGSICQGQSFSIQPNGANSYTIQGGSYVVSPNISTSFTVIGSSIYGCISDTITSNVSVYLNPTISVNSGSICNGQSFTIQPIGANHYTVEGGSFIVSPNTNSTYSITGSSINGCPSSNTVISSVLVYAQPSIQLTGDSLLCLGESTSIQANGAVSYSWSTSAQTSVIVVSPVVSQNYTVWGYSVEGCVSTRVFEVFLSDCLNERELPKIQTSVLVYPNPGFGYFTVECSEAAPFNVYNSLGQLVFSDTTSAVATLLDFTMLPDGIYFLKVFTKTESPTLKLIKE